MWILTTEYNLYDQQGEYFVAAWDTKPNLTQLARLQALRNRSEEELTHILAGGGRRKLSEHQWWILDEYTPET